MIDMMLYEQMGFSQEQVRRAEKLSKERKIDIFDALQLIQKQPEIQEQNSHKQPFAQRINPESGSSKAKSVAAPIKSFDLSKFELIYSKSRTNLTHRRVDLREEKMPVGLLNVHNCCYLNSLLQCYFLSSEFVEYIFEAEPLDLKEFVTEGRQMGSKMTEVKFKRIKNEYNLLFALKEMFGRMCLTSKKYIDPTEVLRNLVNSVGEKVEFGDEKDLFETNIEIIERLNECLLYTKKYYKKGLDSSQKSLQSEEETQVDLLSQQISRVSSDSPSKSASLSTLDSEANKIKRLFYGQKIEYTDSLQHQSQIEPTKSDFLGIILNPSYENLYRALDEEFHYEVEIEHKKANRHTYIVDLPKYLYFYINRTAYNSKEQQAQKNEEKLSFDFVIYLDRYLHRYKEQSTTNVPIIRKLIAQKSDLKKRKNEMEIFERKLTECRVQAQRLGSDSYWVKRLPAEDEISEEKQKMNAQLEDIERELEKVESRKEKYYLMYIFTHRGDAVSGHYWGYGRNRKNNWFRFDINTRLIKEEEILLDLYKSGGTPYSLVYVKKEDLPDISYSYHCDFAKVLNSSSKSQDLRQLPLPTDGKEELQSNTYLENIPAGIQKVVVSENIELHREADKKRTLEIAVKTLQEYSTRVAVIEEQLGNHSQILENPDSAKSSLASLPAYNNFASYLWSTKEQDLSKFNIFATSLKAATNGELSTQRLIKESPLLEKVQKGFRKKVKSKGRTLKHFCIYCEPKESERYKQLYGDFALERRMLETVMDLTRLISTLGADSREGQKGQERQSESPVGAPQKSSTQNAVAKLVESICDISRRGNSNKSYVKCILRELAAVFLIKAVRNGHSLSVSQNQLRSITSPTLFKQLQLLWGSNQLCQNVVSEQEKELEKNCQQLSEEEIEHVWKIEDVAKGVTRSIMEKKLSACFSHLKTEIAIFKKLEKQNTFTKVSKNDQGEQTLSDVKVEQLPQTESLEIESLI